MASGRASSQDCFRKSRLTCEGVAAVYRSAQGICHLRFYFYALCSSHNRSAEKNMTRLSTLSARSRDRSLSFERRRTATRGRTVVPRPTSCSRSGSRERSQTDEVSKTLSRLRTISPASGIFSVSRQPGLIVTVLQLKLRITISLMCDLDL